MKKISLLLGGLLSGCFFISGFDNAAVCGDGVLFEVKEECDDGNNIDRDGCDVDCQLTCGNGVLDASRGEECDDGNNIDRDGCESDCLIFCGNSAELAAAITLDLESGHCYLAFDGPLIWQAAATDCAAQGGHLATIHSLTENEQVFSMFPEELWIGLNDIVAEAGDAQALFVYEDGEPNDFSNFAANQPNGDVSTVDEDCVSFDSPTNSQWFDRDCANARPYVCEFEGQVCGNGFIERNEQCDDGNTTNGDGCNDTCAGQ